MGGTINFAKGSATPKADQILAVLFNGFDSDLDLSSIKFVAPTNASGPNGTTVTLPLASGGTNLDPESSSAHGIGYTLQSLDAAGKLQPYTVGGTFQVVIAYQLPDDNHLQVNDKDFTFTSTLHAADKDQNPGEDCGNASWIFTHDGKHVSPAVGTCGENSFLGNGVFPSTGKAKPGDPVGAYYSDESPIQNRDITDPFWNGQAVNAGIDFELSGGKFTDPATGKGFQIPQSNGSNGGYTLGAFPSGVPTTDKFSTMIKWILPAADDPRWQNGIKYTVFLKAYDTDNNKPGNDCGQGTWSFVLSGATGHGTINLIE
jgi:hypothetical protein